MKKISIVFILLSTALASYAQDRGLAVNKYRHKPLILDSLAKYVFATSVPSSYIAAYSVRKINIYYTGPLLQAQRVSDNATQDIYYTASNYLDTAALKTFIGSGSATVSIWYDQTGNGKNAVQATQSLQPRIMASGVIDRQNNIPTLNFHYGSNLSYMLYTNATVPGNVAHSLNCVARADNGTGNFVAYSTTTSANANSCLGSGNNSVTGCVGSIWIGGYNQDGGYQGGSALAALAVRTKTYTPAVLTLLAVNTGYVNQGQVIQTNIGFSLGNSNIKFGVQDDSNDDPLTGYISEAVLFPVQLATGARVDLEADQKDYYKTP